MILPLQVGPSNHKRPSERREEGQSEKEGFQRAVLPALKTEDGPRSPGTQAPLEAGR